MLCNRIALKLFQDIHKLRGPDYWVIGDQWEIKVSGGSGNEPVVKLGDVGDLRCSFEDLQAQRFKLIILAF
jgi:hypothetical protein